jgi:peptidyl-prolyl cis-trans isomerase C
VSVSETDPLRGTAALPRPKQLAWGARAKRIFLIVAKEPLVHFVVAGALLFVAGRIYESQTSTYRIVLTPRHIAQLGNDYALQFGTQPDPRTLDALVRRDVHDEILYRQGVALKLDQDDLIVRRRVVQKMQFLMQDLNPPAEPTTAQLQAYYDAHAGKYVTPPRATFSHIYFSADRPDAEKRARAVLATLNDKNTRAPDRGDPFPDLYDFSAYEPEQVYRLFGHTPFADAVYAVPPGHWAGPFRSGYGWHLVYVDARQPQARPALSAIHDTVRSDYLQGAQDEANKEAFDKLAARFTIVRGDDAQ